MNVAEKLTAISIDDYLQGELSSEVRHEFVDGMVYAMVGGKRSHSQLITRVTTSLGRQLDGTACEPLSSDFKIRIQRKKRTFFYYPDVSVFCGSGSGNDVFGVDPVVVVEVLSDSTRRTDEGEKRDNYLSIPSLQSYVLIEQDEVKAVVYQRSVSGDFDASVYHGAAPSSPWRPSARSWTWAKSIVESSPTDENWGGWGLD